MPLVKLITNMKVRCRHQPQSHRSAGQRCYRCKSGPRDYFLPIPVLTTTSANMTFKMLPGSKQFDSNSRALMLDDGTSDCITNDKGDFIEPPKRVDHKVRGIKVLKNPSSLSSRSPALRGSLMLLDYPGVFSLRLLVYMYLSQLMRTFTNYLKCIVISS